MNELGHQEPDIEPDVSNFIERVNALLNELSEPIIDCPEEAMIALSFIRVRPIEEAISRAARAIKDRRVLMSHLEHLDDLKRGYLEGEEIVKKRERAGQELLDYIEFWRKFAESTRIELSIDEQLKWQEYESILGRIYQDTTPGMN